MTEPLINHTPFAGLFEADALTHSPEVQALREQVQELQSRLDDASGILSPLFINLQEWVLRGRNEAEVPLEKVCDTVHKALFALAAKETSEPPLSESDSQDYILALESLVDSWKDIAGKVVEERDEAGSIVRELQGLLSKGYDDEETGIHFRRYFKEKGLSHD